jgi:SAM-dependent methyltransferase
VAPDISRPVFARIYPRIERFARAHGADAHREELLDGVAGRVLEIGAGAGANFRFYPSAVDYFVAVEPEPRLRAQAERAAREVPFPVEVLSGTAEDLPVPNGAFDTVVASLVLCSVQNVDRSVAEIRRVLKPGGELRFYEHILSLRPRFARAQRAANLIWPIFFGGCHLTRDPESAFVRGGLRIDHARHFDFLINGRPNPSSPFVIGCASKP